MLCYYIVWRLQLIPPLAIFAPFRSCVSNHRPSRPQLKNSRVSLPPQTLPRLGYNIWHHRFTEVNCLLLPCLCHATTKHRQQRDHWKKEKKICLFLGRLSRTHNVRHEELPCCCHNCISFHFKKNCFKNNFISIICYLNTSYYHTSEPEIKLFICILFSSLSSLNFLQFFFKIYMLKSTVSIRFLEQML